MAPKHHSRNRSHAWQEVTKYDLIYLNYVWQHVRGLNGQCMQAGAPVPDQYRSMMRLDVVPPAAMKLILLFEIWGFVIYMQMVCKC